VENDDIESSDTTSRRIIGRNYVDTSHWATPDEGALEGDKRDQYFARKQAVLLFLAGASFESIKRLTSIGGKQAYRLIRERCLEIHVDGKPYGWRGLVRHLRIKPYKRKSKVQVDCFGYGAVGGLQAILDFHPELHDAFISKILASTSNRKLVETKRTKKRHCVWFLDQLRQLGYEARGEWPFNTKSLGYYSVRRYIDTVLDANPRALAESVGGLDLVKKLKTGDGINRPVTRFMQRVEMDAHKLDGRFCISIPMWDGSFKEKMVHRLWVIVILEVISRAVIGYYLSMRREVSKDDVLRAIKNGLSRWVPRQVSFSDTPYLSGAGLLSVLGDDFVGLCWDETSVDGALAETCQTVRDSLRHAVNSVLLDPNTSFSKRRSKDDRPYIEAYFRNLSSRGFQRLSNTTGAKPQDRKGTQPEHVALTSRFQIEYAEELLDVLIANYNATPHRGIGDRTPLDYARFLYKQSSQNLRHADQAVVEAFFSTRKRCVVRGGAKSGRAPFVEFYYGRYSNEVLHNRQDLVGSEIWVVCHKENDCRIALGSTLDGVSLGVLRAAPPWHLSPHSLSVRTAIHQASSRGKFSITGGCDAIEVFISHIENQPQNKLPVHPAYLEARRILVAAAEQSIGISMLESAKERAKENNSSNENVPLNKSETRIQTKNISTSNSNLPPRRMTASR
jgi:hypothetical protein